MFGWGGELTRYLNNVRIQNEEWKQPNTKSGIHVLLGAMYSTKSVMQNI